VLAEAGRIRPVEPESADLLLAHAGAGLERRGGATAVLVVPPADATVLPALNRRLADAGIHWRYVSRGSTGSTELAGAAVPAPLEGVRVDAGYRLERSAEPVRPTRTLAELGGSPWAVEGTDAAGRRYLLLGSPLESAATTLPVSTGMLRFVDWAASEWASAGGVTPELTAGTHLPAPGSATHVRFPGGSEFEIDGTRTVRGTGEAGFYTFLTGDSVVAVVAMNPPSEESTLDPLDEDRLASAIGDEVVPVDGRGAWRRAVYRSRQGPELWWPLLLAVLLLLLGESLMATSGRRESRRAAGSPTPTASTAGVAP